MFLYKYKNGNAYEDLRFRNLATSSHCLSVKVFKNSEKSDKAEKTEKSD